MSQKSGKDCFCLYRGVWVALSEFNSDSVVYHEPENSVPYVASPYGKCRCVSCSETNRLNCDSCDMPRKLDAELRTKMLKRVDVCGNFLGGEIPQHRCDMCTAQYKVNGKLR